MSTENTTPELVARPQGTVMRRTGYDAQTRARLDADAAQVIARYPQERSALLPLLHLVQSEDGYVSPAGVAFCAQTLHLSTAEVSAVATFYTQYKRRPNGEYTVGVCTNTLCGIMGGDAIWDELSDHLGVGHDETTDDGAITLEKIECNAACDYAPVVMVNWEFFDNQTPASAVEVADRLRAGEPVAPTRGAASVASFKDMSRVLAGFSDGRADEGVGAGPATVRGTVLARERGWTAPSGAPAPAAAAPEAATAAPKAAAPKAAAPKAAARKATPRKSAASTSAAAPAVGGEQSSAERTPTTPADVSSAEQVTKQTSDQAKES